MKILRNVFIRKTVVQRNFSTIKFDGLGRGQLRTMHNSFNRLN